MMQYGHFVEPQPRTLYMRFDSQEIYSEFPGTWGVVCGSSFITGYGEKKPGTENKKNSNQE